MEAGCLTFGSFFAVRENVGRRMDGWCVRVHLDVLCVRSFFCHDSVIGCSLYTKLMSEKARDGISLSPNSLPVR